MNVHTAFSLHNSRRCLTSHIERAELVLAEMKRGASLHLQHTPRGPNGRCRWAARSTHRSHA